MPTHGRIRDPCQAQLHRPSRNIRHLRLHRLNYPRPHSAGPPGDSDSEPVSPVSDTHSISTTPRFQAKDTPGDDFSVGGDLQVPRPISKTQPSWDPFTGTPLVEEEDFEMGQSTDPSPPAPHVGQGQGQAPPPPPPPPPPQATQTVTAVRPRANTADDPYDDWVVVSPQSPPSGQIHVVSPQSPPQAPRSFEPTESSREVDEDDHDATHGSSSTGLFIVQPSQQLQPVQQQAVQQQPVQQQQQQTIHHLPSQQTSPQRQSSFVGLPPIRRSSTFGINLTKRAKKRFPLDEDDDNNFVSSPVATTTDQYGNDGGSSSRYQQGESSWSAQQSAQPIRVDTGPPRFRKDSNMSHNVLSATSTQAATLATESSGMTGQDLRIDDEKRPLGPGVAMKGAARVPGPIDTRAAMQQNDGRTSGPPYGPGLPPHQGIMSPTFGGNPIHHLPPQGPWKLEESHLSEPLATSRNRQSGGSLSPHQQTSFGIDKETGVPSTAAQRPETQLPPRQKFSEVPPSSAQRYPGLFTPQVGYQNPSSPTGPRDSEDLGQHFYNRDSASLYRTQTGDSEVSGVDPSIDEERGRRRSSGFLKEIGGRISRHTSRERPASKAGSGAPSYMAGPDVRGDAVSEASVATGELQDRQRRRSSFFLNLRGSKPSDAGEEITPSPKASPNPGGPSQAQPPPGGPAERKRSFFGPGADQSANFPMPNLSRSSTSTAGYEVAGGAMGPPKKRFSGFTSKVFPRSSSQQDLQVPQKPSTSHSTTTSTMFGRPPSTQGSQPGKPSPLAAQGRERSNTTGTKRPVSDLQSERREAPIAPANESHDEHVSRRKSSQMLNMESEPSSQSFDAPAPPSQREQPSPGRRHLTEQRQPSLSFLQAEEQLSRPEQSEDQTEEHWVPPGFSAEPTPEPSIRHSYGRENSPGPQTPPLGQAQGSANHHQALGVQKSGHARRTSEQSASLLSPSSNFRAQSPNGAVGHSDTSQRSSISNSPKPAAVAQMPATRAAVVSDGRGPLPDPRRPSPYSVRSSDHPSNQNPGHNNRCHIQARLKTCSRSRSRSFSRSNLTKAKASKGCHQLFHYRRGVICRNKDPITCTKNSAHPWVPLNKGVPLNTTAPNTQPYVEPQYDQVPIPQGYAAVHGEGGVAPSPYALSRTSPPVQYPAYHSPQVPHWGQPPVAQRHPSEISMYSHPSPPVPQGQQLLQGHPQGAAWPEGDRRVSMASHQSNISHASHSTQAVPGPHGDVPISSQQHQQHQPQQDQRGIRVVNHDDSQIAAPGPQFGQQTMPPTQQPQQQRYSLVDAAAPAAASPQIQQSQSRGIQGKQEASSREAQQNATNVVHNSPDMHSSPHQQNQAHPAQGLAIDASSMTGNNSRSISDNTQGPAERIISPDPPAPAPAPAAPRLSVNVQQANQKPKDNDLYEPTPRLPSNPSQPPAARPIVAANTGHSMVSDSSADEAPRNASHANGSAGAAASTTLARGKSTRAELEDTEDERQRTMRREAQEEKILVDPYEELSSGGVKYRKEEEPADVPQMSATSYPGQEWNPYGAGGYEDWD
ncbi:hypothetical protein BDP81DRAFT_310766 [Colletotrichum phormii]|uniref:Uncharacterized protein n=1 Tax=Colletotrichum phormii TaxID=359342 RepID=A0AAJ0A0H9_9PEZI|nr:uncharacterized protein BDP81DRAFT_310766 [Colletotrichum phormii]KAK1641271.1 hypothetical protein BDP81DRAFT_310766 [Colletotrichum phormii]